MSRRWGVRLLGVVLLLTWVPGAYAQSQATTGVIEGTVVDETGAVLPGATVTLRNTATNYTQALVTGGDGRFRALLLPLGPYRITVGLQGFSTLVREGLDLAVGQTINLKLPLTISAVEDQITVTAEAPVVETTRAEGATRIDARSVESLPNNGRNFLDYTKLTPGVSIVQGPDGDELSINGQKGIHNNVSVDGADFNNPFFGEQRGGQRPAFTFNLDAVQDFVVVSDGANAEFGRSGGGFVNIITKSGTNQFSGSAHYFGKYDALSADPSHTSASGAITGFTPDFAQHQFGATLGGPIVRDRAFFFLAYDQQEYNETKQLTRSGFDTPQAAALIAFTDTAFGGALAGDFGPISRTNDANAFMGKLDFRL